MKKKILFLCIAMLFSCSYVDDSSQKMSDFSSQMDAINTKTATKKTAIKFDISSQINAINTLDYKYVFKREQDRRGKLLQDLMHKYPNKSKEQLEKEYIIEPLDKHNTWHFEDFYGGVDPVLHGNYCTVMNEFHFKADTGVVFDQYSDYAAENASAYFGITQINRGAFNLPLRYVKLIKLCELCHTKYPEIANPWKQYLIKKLQQDVKSFNKNQLINWYGEDITKEIISYAGNQIQKNE